MNRWLALCALFAACRPPADLSELDPAMQRLAKLTLTETLPPRPDPSNRFADDPAAAALGQKLFFDPRFSGPLLDDANNGTSGTLGKQGETGKVACASCHIPLNNFLDGRTSRRQISLGAGWTQRRAPSLLGVGYASLLMWDGRRDAAYNQVFGPLESPVEMNSSRLFVAQQMSLYYRAEYEALFGPLPSLADFAPLAPADAGCTALSHDPLHDSCPKPANDDVTRVVVNFGKAVSAYLRLLNCGPGRFDAWMNGDTAALTEQEQRGAMLFVGKGGCDDCHSGPNLSDQAFHNVGLVPAMVAIFFTDKNDRGAADGIAAALQDPLNVRGAFSDGDDGRLDRFTDTEALLGSFRTPSLRCVSSRPTFMHTGQYRTLVDAVLFFRRGSPTGYIGTKENAPRDLSDEDVDDLVAFLGSFEGPGPPAQLLQAP